ncbi:MAG: S41 family peptidase [Planctomycetota bacterium]
MPPCARTVLAITVLAAPLGRTAPAQVPVADPAEVFDRHWERLRDDYPYFDLYAVDWEAERAEHRPRAVAATSATELAWEIARMLTALDDAHVAYVPPPSVLAGWAVPALRIVTVERRPLVLDWGGAPPAGVPDAFAGDPHAYPEVVSVAGARIGCAVEVLAAGPPGTTVDLGLRWSDGTETVVAVSRDAQGALPPKRTHYGEQWIHSGRVGSLGYLRVRTFDPSRCTLGPEGKMTPVLRAHLKRLGDTEGLVLDLRGNGGGLVAASDPFLRHFVTRTLRYRWGRSGGRSRVITPRSPRYRGEVVVLVDGGSASGGEWAARILRDAGRAAVVGGRTQGAEAAVLESTADDGSTIHFSGWPMVEPGVTPFQEDGVELDHEVALTIEDVRARGYEDARQRARRARFARALEELGGALEQLDALLRLADASEVDPVR